MTGSPKEIEPRATDLNCFVAFAPSNDAAIAASKPDVASRHKSHSAQGYATMPSSSIRIPSSSGGVFDCYLTLPASAAKTPAPAIVLACAIVGVDEDLRAIADEFAAHGYIAAAPDLFWRSVPGPLPHQDSRTRPRGQPRLEKIKAGEVDMADTLKHVYTRRQHNETDRRTLSDARP
jgi:hypothetical protein